MERLREARKKKHLTMKQLGAMVGVTEAAISHYELGKRQPDYDLAVKLSECLGVTVDYLLGRESPEPPAPVQEQEKAPGSLDDQIMKELEDCDTEQLREVLNFIRFRKQGGN